MSRPASRAQLYTIAAGMLVVTVAFAWYAVHRAELADHRQHVAASRDETQRRAICAILANIPGDVPPAIESARAVFARPGHPDDCQPIHHPKPTPAPTPGRAARPTVLVVPSGGGASSPPAASRPSPHPTRTPRPHPSSSPSPRPTPSPSPTCSLQHPLHCLPLTSAQTTRKGHDPARRRHRTYQYVLRPLHREEPSRLPMADTTRRVRMRLSLARG